MAPRLPAVALAAGLCVTLLAGCAFGPPTGSDGGGPPNLPTPTRTQSNDNSPPSVIATVIAKDMRIPWAVAFLPDGGALVTERATRQIVKIGPGSDVNGLKKVPVQTIDEANANGEGGLMGIAVSPDYRTDQTVFIYYSTTTDNRNDGYVTYPRLRVQVEAWCLCGSYVTCDGSLRFCSRHLDHLRSNSRRKTEMQRACLIIG